MCQVCVIWCCVLCAGGRVTVASRSIKGVARLALKVVGVLSISHDTSERLYRRAIHVGLVCASCMCLVFVLRLSCVYLAFILRLSCVYCFAFALLVSCLVLPFAPEHELGARPEAKGYKE